MLMCLGVGLRRRETDGIVDGDGSKKECDNQLCMRNVFVFLSFLMFFCLDCTKMKVRFLVWKVFIEMNIRYRDSSNGTYSSGGGRGRRSGRRWNGRCGGMEVRKGKEEGFCWMKW